MGQLFYIRLLEQEHAVYNIATDELISQSVEDIAAKTDAILIPFIDKLEGDLCLHEKVWIQCGFFAHKKGFTGSGLEFVMNLKFIAAYFGKEKAEECLKNYLLTLTPDERSVFRDTLTGKIGHDTLKKSMLVKYMDAKELGLNLN